jgi:lipopolysaccharide/colanic/teichoic acid biosynthesis glycosyltransferase
MLVLGRSAMWDMRQIYPHLRQVRFSGFEVVTPMDVAEVYCGRIPLNLIDEAETMRMGIEDGFAGMLRLKRVYDLTIAIIGGILSIPILAIACGLIKLTAPKSPVFYSQERVGRFGKTFMIKKLRTMHPHAEDDTGAVWSTNSDPRITPVGRLLRKFRIDELPQFWNVLMGDMSLVGPRPERPEIVCELEKQIPFYSEREYALPGVTGWAQIHCPYGNSVEAARRKLEYDLFYIKNMSPSLDLQIMLRTLRTVLFGQEKES